MLRSRSLAALILSLAAAPAVAQTSYPMVTRIQPAAVRRGETVEVAVAGQQNFAGASSFLFEGSGLSAEILADAAKDGAKPAMKGGGGARDAVKAKLTVAADAALGPRQFRVVTPQGVSSVGQVVIVADPVVAEADDKANDDFKTAPKVALPAVLTGTIGKVEDVDWYAFEAEAGQTVTFSVWGNRLENVIHDLQTHLDPILQLHDAEGRELAGDDNRHYADPLLTYRFEKAGTYAIQIRDTNYAGNPSWSYVVIATPGPFATSAFPMAVRPGETAELNVRGANIDPVATIRLDVPADTEPGIRPLTLPTDRGTTPPLPMVVTRLPVGREADDANEDPAQAQPIALPVACSGRLGAANDIDGYRFEATKGTVYSFEVVARRALSAADPVLRIVDAKGKQLAEADDTLGKDPRLEWTAPADGSYTALVLDLHSRGGDDFGYVLLAEPASPDFLLTCDPDKLNLGPGARTPLFVQVERRGGFKGPVTIELEGSLAGVTASPLTIPEAMTQGEIIVEAAADAAQGASLVRLVGRADRDGGDPLVQSATPRQEIYLPGGGRGLFDVETLAMAVGEPADITVEASVGEVTLTPGGTATIEVKVTRREGFDKPVNLAVTLAHLNRVYASALPPGVSMKDAGSKTLLGPKETQGKIVLEAKADAAPCRDVPIAVMGHVSINFVVKTAYCTAPIRVTVVPKP